MLGLEGRNGKGIWYNYIVILQNKKQKHVWILDVVESRLLDLNLCYLRFMCCQSLLLTIDSRMSVGILYLAFQFDWSHRSVL